MRVQELTKQYDGKTVVDGVSFAIPKGKVISLIGPNGAGKSTVMGMISRLIAHDSGLVDFEGKDIGKWIPNPCQLFVNMLHSSRPDDNP